MGVLHSGDGGNGRTRDLLPWQNVWIRTDLPTEGQSLFGLDGDLSTTRMVVMWVTSAA